MREWFRFLLLDLLIRWRAQVTHQPALMTKSSMAGFWKLVALANAGIVIMFLFVTGAFRVLGP